MKKEIKNKIIIYQAKNGAIELRGDFDRNTIWATQEQIAKVFQLERSVITKHIRNILSDNELVADSVCAKFAHTANDGKIYQVQFYNLDIILSVGYRANSQRAIEFRKWATKILNQHITKGYTINSKVIKNNYAEFQKVIENIKYLLSKNSKVNNTDIVELISAFADTWLSLEAYDKDNLSNKGITKKSVTLTTEQIQSSLNSFKNSLQKKGEATELFGQEREQNVIAGIIGNIMQTFAGKPLYPTVEEKAAHLLYFIVKNHPFVDGNKRNGAYAFIWFLNKAGILNREKINPATLTVITLLIAESKPSYKDKMIRLVLQLLKK